MTDERQLQDALAAAPDDASRATIHTALAVYWGQRCLFRKMNHHEEAAVVCLANVEGNAHVTEGHRLYREAIDAFGDVRDEDGRRLLRRAVTLLREPLGELHPYTRQVLSTLAGRLRGVAGTEEERLALRQALAASAEALYGPTHANTLRCGLDVAYALRVAGRDAAAIVAFEGAFDAFIAPRSSVEGPSGDLIAREGAVEAFRALQQMGVEARTAEREAKLLALSDRFFSTVRDSRLRRLPDLRRAYELQVLAHAEAHIPAQPADSEAYQLLRGARVLLDAPASDEYPNRIADLAIDIVEAVEDFASDDDSDGPLVLAEHAWQRALFESLYAME